MVGQFLGTDERNHRSPGEDRGHRHFRLGLFRLRRGELALRRRVHACRQTSRRPVAARVAAPLGDVGNLASIDSPDYHLHLHHRRLHDHDYPPRRCSQRAHRRVSPPRVHGPPQHAAAGVGTDHCSDGGPCDPDTRGRVAGHGGNRTGAPAVLAERHGKARTGTGMNRNGHEPAQA